jgi:hypothetical protein
MRQSILLVVLFLSFSGTSRAQSAAALQVPNHNSTPTPCNPTRGLLYGDATANTTRSCPSAKTVSHLGARSPATLSNSLQRNSGPGGLALRGIADGGTPKTAGETTANIDADLHTKGPDPWFDITNYGARSVASPPTTTATITRGQKTAVLANGSLFQNGDSIRINYAGPATTLATPVGLRVAPYVNAGGSTSAPFTGAEAGVTTYAYKIIACDKQGGCTASSADSTSVTSQATLGRVTAKISSIALSNQALTVTTATAHGFSTEALVYIQYFSTHTPLFEGFYIIATVPDAKHFTVSVNYDSRVNSTPVSDTSGGTAVSFNCNHLQWAPTPNAWKYYIYGRSGNSFNLVGVTRPMENWWDDYGSSMMDNFSYPNYIPKSAPTSATHQYLLTTIVSGGGTNNITMSETASNSVVGSPAVFGSDAAILAAFKAAATGTGTGMGAVYIPAGVFFTAGFFTTPKSFLPYRIIQNGSLFLGDTLQFANPVVWTGFSAPSASAFQWNGAAVIVGGSANPAFPMIYMSQGASGSQFDHLNFRNFPSNGGLIFLGDVVTNLSWDYVTMGDGGGANQDYMGQLLDIRGDFSFRFNKCTFVVGQAPDNTEASIGYTFQPGIVIRPRVDGTSTAGGNASFEHSWFVGRAGVEQNASPGRPGDPAPGGVGLFRMSDIQTQNMPIPLVAFSSYPNVNPVNGGTYMETITPADFPTAVVANFNMGNTNGISNINPIGSLQGGHNWFTGNPMAGVAGLSSGLNREGFAYAVGVYANQPKYGLYTGGQFSVVENLDMTAGHGITVPFPSVSVPSVRLTECSANCLQAATFSFKVSTVGADAGESTLGLQSLPITTNGSQNVIVSWTDVPGVVGYRVYGCTGSGTGCTLIHSCGGSLLPLVQSNTCTASYGFTDRGAQSLSSTGLPSLYPGEVSTKTLRIASTTAGDYGVATLFGNFTANRAQSFPDATGTHSLLNVQSCGTNSKCAAKTISLPRIVYGSTSLVAGSPSSVTITSISPAFSSARSYICTATNATTAANGVKVANLSASSFTITGAIDVTDTINYICVGD